MESHTKGVTMQTSKRIATPSVLASFTHPTAWPFWGIHLSVFFAFFTGVSGADFVVLAGVYCLQMFGVTAGYHRYFSHRSFKTSRVFQFVLAFLAQSSVQKGVLWWAAHHRGHHKHSDMEGDAHSPVLQGFWYSHVGWIMDAKNDATRTTRVRDLDRFPELRWLNRYHVVPPIVLGALVLLLFGWSGLWIGFMLSTVLSWHATYTINSLAHVWGSRRYETSDDSRNNGLLALIAFGEGWHNNHHHDMNAVRQGRRWWEIDLTWYALCALSWVGLVWDLRAPKDRDSRRKRALSLEGA